MTFQRFERSSSAAFGSLFGPILDIIEISAGALNFNDALLVVLQREGVIGDVATFDEMLARFQGFRAIS